MSNDRRERFRRFMRNMDPTSDPIQAIERGFYVAPPDPAGRRISTRLELEPTSSHLLIGGIGSGKTTQLIQIEAALGQVGDVLTARIDVPAAHRLDKLKPGVLVALAAASATNHLRKLPGHVLNPEIASALSRIDTIVKGHWVHDPQEDAPSPDSEDAMWVDGIIESPQTQGGAIASLSEALRSVTAALGQRLVILFDGLDRVLDPKLFASVIREDVPALGEAGIGLVMVGPQHLRLSEQQHIVELFTAFHLHGAVAFHTHEGQAFLESVLRVRAGDGFFPEGMPAKLVTWSGGLLRDLISLARASAEEAYVSGADVIDQTHIDTAADRFGRNLLLSATSVMTWRLKKLVPKRSSGAYVSSGNQVSFALSSDEGIKMLLNRLVIEIPGTPIQYAIHPTIVPLLRGMAGRL